MTWTRRTSTLLVLLAVGALAHGQAPQKPLSKQPQAKNPKALQAKAKPGGVNNRPFFGSGGSWAVGVNGSDDCATAPAINGSGDFAFDTTGATTGARARDRCGNHTNSLLFSQFPARGARMVEFHQIEWNS